MLQILYDRHAQNDIRKLGITNYFTVNWIHLTRIYIRLKLVAISYDKESATEFSKSKKKWHEHKQKILHFCGGKTMSHCPLPPRVGARRPGWSDYRHPVTRLDVMAACSGVESTTGPHLPVRRGCVDTLSAKWSKPLAYLLSSRAHLPWLKKAVAVSGKERKMASTSVL